MTDTDSEETQPNTASNANVTHEIESIGAVRARQGTSTEILAGAASFWNKEAKKYQLLLAELTTRDNQSLKQSLDEAWRDGCLTACVTLSVLGVIVLAVHHFLR